MAVQDLPTRPTCSLLTETTYKSLTGTKNFLTSFKIKFINADPDIGTENVQKNLIEDKENANQEEDK